MSTSTVHSVTDLPSTPYQCEIDRAQAFLHALIQNQADAAQCDWLQQQREKIQASHSPRYLYMAFSSASRHFKKTPLSLSEVEKAQAEALRHGLQPQHWNLLQAVRVFFLLMLPVENKETFLSMLGQLLETADMDEQQAIYAALPLLPYPEALVARTRDGLRTNIVSVFDAIALHNPYAADFLPEEAWNQMMLKAIFLHRPLYRIHAADARANPKLAAMLVDFAHERWAAGRVVTPELWRFVGPFMDESTLADVERVIRGGNDLEKEAALLACAQSSFSPVSVLKQQKAAKNHITATMQNWNDIGEIFATQNS